MRESLTRDSLIMFDEYCMRTEQLAEYVVTMHAANAGDLLN